MLIAILGVAGMDALDEGMPLARLSEQGHRAIQVLTVGSMDQPLNAHGSGIDPPVILTLRLWMTTADGIGSRPVRTRPPTQFAIRHANDSGRRQPYVSA